MVANTLEKYYIFSTIDETYIEPSLVFIKSLLTHNKVHLHVHCINFSPEAKVRYESMINELWPDDVSLVYEDINIAVTQEHRSTISIYEYLEYEHHNALLSKIVIFNRKYKQYMFHLDVDMIVRGSILDIITEYDKQCIGCEYGFGDALNAGVIIFNTDLIGELPDVTEWLRTLTSRKYFLDEQYIHDLNLKRRTIPLKYCTSFICGVPQQFRDCVIYHFLSEVKPFREFDMKPEFLMTTLLMKEWIDLYDTLPKKYFNKIADAVNRNREMADKFSPICKRIVGDE